MKKVFLIGSMAFLAVTSMGQTTKTVSFGLKANFNLANLSFSNDIPDEIKIKSKPGVSAGGFANISFSKSFSIQPELMYAMQGAKVTEAGGPAEVTLNLDYITIPVMFQYKLASGFYAETGPQVGFLLSAKTKAAGNSEDSKDEFKKTDFAWGLGLGYKMKSGLGFGARYNLGLSNIAKDGNNDEGAKNRAFQIGISYTFGK